MSNLSQPEIDAIDKDAEEKFGLYPFEKVAYIAGATAERQRAKVLLDGLKKIEQMPDTYRYWQTIAEMKEIATQTLHTYNKNKPNDRE